MKNILRFAALTAAVATSSFAGETRSWTQSTYADFEKGNFKNISIRSDGRLSLAPRTTELYDSSTAYLWALAQDSRGNLYTAGGPGAKLFRIPPNGKGEKVAEFDALEIHAIAIDSKDRVYVATAPDGKIWRVSANGKTEEFYDPKQKYIWSMVCDAAGNLYVATGDQGEVHKVTPEGKGEVFFKTDETHARSMALDHEGNLIVGTEPGGLVIRVSPKGEGFVLYQMSKREVTALAIGPMDEIYAAALGSKTAPIAPPASLTAPPPPGARPAGQAAPQAAAATITILGGSEVYRLAPREAPRKLWTHAQDLVYALALDANNHLLIGSGNKGNLYRVEARPLYSTLVSFPVAQITALLPGKDGTVYAATGNVGKVFRIGPGTEPAGTIESDVFDTGGFSVWGRLTAAAEGRGGSIELRARSGNLDRPQQNWSAWSKPIGPDGGLISAPPARFIQWQATLKAEKGQNSPSLDSVEAAYLQQNVAPVIDQIEITPANYKFPEPVAPLITSSPATLTLPPIGATPSTRTNAASGGSGITPSLTYAKGVIGARWAAADDNGDTLIYQVEIRGEKEKTWKVLRTKVRERYFSFDSSAFPDGEYRLRVTASDAPSNTPENALSAQEDSDPFTIDNTPPQITKPAAKGGAVQWHVDDALSLIRKVEYSLDGGDWTVVEPASKLSDAQSLDYVLTLKAIASGEHTIAVRATDDFDNVAVVKLAI
jgi:hypothetical protein